MSQTPAHKSPSTPALCPAARTTRSASTTFSRGLVREDYLDDRPDPALLHPVEVLEPPNKRFRVEPQNGRLRRTSSSLSSEFKTLTAEPFDAAYQRPDDYFRVNIKEGTKSIMKRLEVNVRHGLALWAKAISSLMNDDVYQPAKPPVAAAADAKEEEAEEAAEVPAEKVDENTEIKLTASDRECLTDGLAFIEALSFGTGRNQPRLPLVYVVEESLHVGAVDLYEATHRIVLAVEKHDGASLGASMLFFLRAVLDLGAEVRLAKELLPERSTFKAPSQKQNAAADKLTPYNQGPCFVGTARYIPPPPATHAARQARTFAIISAVGHFVHKCQTAQPAAPEQSSRSSTANMSPPTVPSAAQPSSSSNVATSAYPSTNSAARVMPAPPSLRKLFGARASASNAPAQTDPAVNHWSDLRLTALPQWVISCLMELASRFDGQVVAALDQAWYSNYASHIDFRNFGFTGLHDVVSSLPGITLSNEGSEYIVRTFPHIMETAVSQKWPGGSNTRPMSVGAGHEKGAGQQAHVDKQRLMLMQQMLQMQMQLAAIAGAAAASGQPVAQNRFQLQAHQAAAAAANGLEAAAAAAGDSSSSSSAQRPAAVNVGAAIANVKKSRAEMAAQWAAQHRK